VNNFTDYSTKQSDMSTEVSDTRKSFVKWTKEMKEHATTIDTFGPVRISYSIDKETLNLKIKTTHELSSLLEEGAKLCPRRVTLATNAQLPLDIEHEMRPATRVDAGEVTENTLRYLQKILDLPIGVGFVDGKCSTQMFMYVSNAIYEGETIKEKGVRWSDILHSWDFPSGKYFTIYG